MLLPMTAMVLLTVIVAGITVTTRMRSVKQGQAKARYFKLMGGSEVPEDVIKTGRNFDNQFQVPMLFYVVGTLYLALNVESSLAVNLAWAFVVFRCVHAYIHITYNHVLHRLIAFFIGFLCVLAMWINLALTTL